MEEKEVIEQLKAENEALRNELVEKAMIPFKSANDIQYFTNINGVYAKDVDGRAETAELRTLVGDTYVHAYTTMPVIEQAMLGQVAMYVGASDSNYKQGCFYVASTDGAAEPTYSWVKVGGGRTETVLYSAVDATLGDITLSQAYTGYDVLYVGFGFSDNFDIFRRYMTIPTAMITFGTGSFIIDSDPTNASRFVAYNFDENDATKIAYSASGGSGNYLFIKEIIGIKY